MSAGAADSQQGWSVSTRRWETPAGRGGATGRGEGASAVPPGRGGTKLLPLEASPERVKNNDG